MLKAGGGSGLRHSRVRARSPMMGGCLVTRFALGFGSKFWHDLLGAVYELRDFARGANRRRSAEAAPGRWQPRPQSLVASHEQPPTAHPGWLDRCSGCRRDPDPRSPGRPSGHLAGYIQCEVSWKLTRTHERGRRGHPSDQESLLNTHSWRLWQPVIQRPGLWAAGRIAAA